MNLIERLAPYQRVFLDTAPAIYFIENNPRYANTLQPFFARMSEGEVQMVTSSVTLAECLVLPYRLGIPEAAQVFWELLVSNQQAMFTAIDANVANRAAQLRAQYNLTLTDAFQVSVALETGCDAFLTNDITLKRVQGLEVIVIEEVL